MINEEDVQTFSILDNKTAVLTDSLNQKGIRTGKKYAFLFFLGVACFLALFTKNNSIISDHYHPIGFQKS